MEVQPKTHRSDTRALLDLPIRFVDIARAPSDPPIPSTPSDFLILMLPHIYFITWCPLLCLAGPQGSAKLLFSVTWATHVHPEQSKPWNLWDFNVHVGKSNFGNLQDLGQLWYALENQYLWIAEIFDNCGTSWKTKIGEILNNCGTSRQIKFWILENQNWEDNCGTSREIKFCIIWDLE